MTATIEETAADAKRQWARDNGYSVGARGRLPRDAEDAWQRAHATYDSGVTEDDFLEADEPPEAPETVAEDDEPLAGPEERPSRPPRAGRGRFRFRMPTAAGPRVRKARPQRKQHKWLSVRHLIEDAYSELGWAAKPIPPLSRMFYAQAPMAGVILEPAIKGSLPDRLILQPMARNYEKYKAVMGLMGPPFFLMGVLATSPRPAVRPDGQPVLRPVLDAEGHQVTHPETGQPALEYVIEPPGFEYKAAMVGLRYSIGVMVDAAGGENVKRITERAQEREDREEKINDFLAFILGMPVMPMPEDREEHEAAEAGLKLVGAADRPGT